MELLMFDQALEQAGKRRHLLLGNGFSIALRPKIFHYGSLFEKANFSAYPEVEKTFESLGTEDFEEAVQALEGAATVLPGFLPDPHAICSRMSDCAVKIKDVLVRTIATQHPSKPSDISDSQYEACLDFLKNFLKGPNEGKIYTLNYDILLYWTLMHGFGKDLIRFNDGFRSDIYNEGTKYVVWDDSEHKQNIYYLHGALHLFDGGHELQKYTWCRTDEPLIEQTRDAIHKDLFPLFVAEGSWEKKLRKICHHSYLSKGQRSLASITGTLFMHGLSLADNDTHILRVVEQNSKIDSLFVGLHGDCCSEGNQKIINRARAIATQRGSKRHLAVNFYDSANAKVWG